MFKNAASSCALALLAALLLQPAFAAQPGTDASSIISSHAGQVLVGKVYSKDSKQPQLLYNFRRTAERKNGALHVERTYTYPDGKVAAVETATYRNGNLVAYSVDEKQIGAHGNLKIDGDAFAGQGTVQFSYTADGSTDTGKETLSGPTVVNDDITAYMQAHWNDLMAGKTLNVRYLVIPRQETVGFSLTKAGEDNWNGREVVNVKMEPSSFFIGLIVDPVYFTFDKKTGEIIQYTGRTTPKIKKNGDWQPLDAVTALHWQAAQGE
ncbi:MAG TPA: hypothetical protein VFK45_10980 [Gammaproteobacteria bacterium]|nr:hypothetical protein [Gammaproteobacteria bacterium]